MIANEEKLIEASNRETEATRLCLIESMTELTTLRVCQALARKEQALPPERKAEAVAEIEAMLRSEMEIAKRVARQKTELLETEKELHANLKQSQSLK